MIVFGRNDRKIDRIIILVITQRSCETAYLCLEIGDVIGVNVFPSMLMRLPTPPQKGLKHPYYTSKIWFNIAQWLLSETASNQLTALFASSQTFSFPRSRLVAQRFSQWFQNERLRASVGDDKLAINFIILFVAFSLQ